MVFDVVLVSVGDGLWSVEVDGVLLQTLVSGKAEFFDLFGELVFGV